MSSHSSEMCIGIDVGGTFTDAVMTDGRGIWRAKSLTTPEDLGSGVIEACRLAAERAGRTLEGVIPTLRRFGLGTTAVTNVLATRRGRRIGLITTKGFEDLVPMARGRTFPEDGRLVPPPELVSRRHIIGVAERIDRNGQVLVTLDPEEVVRAARILVEQGGVEALAVSFLWSFLNPLHEDAAVEAIFEVFPDLLVVSGAAVHPQIREFERTNVALLNAYTSGAFKGIDALETKLRTMGLPVPILVVHSGGGSITTGEARRFPIGLAESGPAAGVAAAAMVADAANVSDVIACDLGGTSFEVAVISGGEIMRRSRSEVMGIYTAISVVDVESIGAGGGSIGWMDALGMLRVGPHSAGANPGPACYGRGGQEPTVTDALVVLGFIDPERFLGGDLQLDADGARVACETLGTKLGMDYEETAWGIREIALSGMVKAVQSRLAARGLDPRSHAMFSYGGCGALFCPDLARMISSRVVIVPELASVLSGFGAATTDVRRERVRSVLATLPIDMVSVEKICAELCAEVTRDLDADGIPESDRLVTVEADLRFYRQSAELSIPFPTGPLDQRAFDEVLEAFLVEYGKRYGKGSITRAVPVELALLRAVGKGQTVRASLGSGHDQAVPEGTPAVPAATRWVRVNRGEGGRLEVASYYGPDLRPGHEVVGPALIDDLDTTVWIPVRARARIDGRGTLTMELEP